MGNAFLVSVCATLFLMSFAISDFARAELKSSASLRSTHRLMGFWKNKNQTLGQEHWLHFESSLAHSGGLSAQIEVLASAGDYRTSLYQDTDKTDLSNQASEIWPGEMYLQFAAGALLARAGYQRVSWQEGFSFSYTNFINPRDQRASLFEESDVVFRSVPMLNAMVSGESLSLQVLLIPFAAMDLVPPFSRVGRNSEVPLLPFQKVEVRDVKLQSGVFDYGVRSTWAGEGFDLSVFGARIHDRQSVYELDAESDGSRLLLRPTQSPMSTYGFTSSVVTGESAWRLEFMHIPSRKIGRVTALGLHATELSESDLTLGYDSPAWGDFSMGLQHSVSLLSEEPAGLLRRRQESLSFARFDYGLGTDRNIRLLAVFLHGDQSVFGRLGYRWPLNRQTELEVALEAAGGAAGSQGSAMNDLARFFCQLTHTL